MALPFASAATTLLTAMLIVVEDGFAATWNVATATPPSGKVAAFTPNIRQVSRAQVSVFPAALTESATTTVRLVMSAG